MRKINRVVITGATSSLGMALINVCIENGIEVLAFVNRNSIKAKYIPVSEKIKVVECSAEEYRDAKCVIETNDITKEYDAFFHLAWLSTSGDAERNRADRQIQNIEYSIHSVVLAEALGCKVYIGAGSQAEYGRTCEILTEETVCKPESAYGASKLCAGQMTRIICREKGIDHIWPRILSAYGPYCQQHTIINHTITELLAGRSPQLTACEQIWDFVYTEDVAEALLLLAQKGGSGQIYVVGYGESRPLKQFIDVIKKIIGGEAQISYGARPYGDMTVMNLQCDISKIRSDTGFRPQISFEEGIERTIRWIQRK